MDERRQYRGGFVWPIILIGAGIVFLLNNLGMVDWSVWQALIRLWPLFLIAIGLDILVGRRFPLGSLLLALVFVVVLVLAVQGAIPQTVTASAMTVDRTWTISEDLQGAERGSVDIKFGAGNLNVDSLTKGSAQLIQGEVELSRNEQLNKSYSGSGGAANFVLESQGPWSVGPEVFGDSEKKWDLSLNRDIPLDLKIDAGAGKAALDLTNLSVRRFVLDGGVGQVTVKLPEAGRYAVEVDGGVGQMIIIVPQGLAARFETNGGLTGVSTEGQFRHEDDAYVTGNYASAENRADVKIEGGVGQIVLRALSE